mmetsp:Transcript_13844/g.38261  ORF Transcript_13844/g.38261 Transcript_13844/m.38261 type:complete len:307 (-) Transcript_13844:77-997(-)
MQVRRSNISNGGSQFHCRYDIGILVTIGGKVEIALGHKHHHIVHGIRLNQKGTAPEFVFVALVLFSGHHPRQGIKTGPIKVALRSVFVIGCFQSEGVPIVRHWVVRNSVGTRFGRLWFWAESCSTCASTTTTKRHLIVIIKGALSIVIVVKIVILISIIVVGAVELVIDILVIAENSQILSVYQQPNNPHGQETNQHEPQFEYIDISIRVGSRRRKTESSIGAITRSMGFFILNIFIVKLFNVIILLWNIIGFIFVVSFLWGLLIIVMKIHTGIFCSSGKGRHENGAVVGNNCSVNLEDLVGQRGR